MSEAPARPARDASVEELLERTQGLRRELLRRGEFLPPSWAEEAARDLRSGELAGFWLSDDSGAPGLVVYSHRERHVFAHVHVDAGPEAVARSLALLGAVLRALPPGVNRADVGLSGLNDADELEVTSLAVQQFGGEVLLRHCLERLVKVPLDGDVPPPTIEGRRGSIRSATVDRLAELDWAAFQGSPDERLVADTVDEERRGLGELLDGRLGRIVEEASGIFEVADGRTVGMILVAEQSPGRSIVLDLVVDPMMRRRGIGAYLLRSALENLRASGGEHLKLWVTDSNRPARSLYERLGFRLAQSARIYRWNSPTP